MRSVVPPVVLALVAPLAIFLLVLLALTYTPLRIGTPDEWNKLTTPIATVAAAITGALLTGWFAANNMRAQAKYTLELEGKKNEYAEELEALKRVYTQEIEQIKSEESRKLERLKNMLSIRRDAYAKIYAAGRNYYRALQCLQAGEWDTEEASAAAKEARSADCQVLFLSHRADGNWQSICHLCRLMVTVVQDHQALPQTDQEKIEARTKVWMKYAPRLSQFLADIKQEAIELFPDW